MVASHAVARSRTVLVLVVVFVAAAASAPGGDDGEPKRTQVVALRLVGVPEELHDALRAGLSLTPRAGFLSSRKAAYTPRALEEDRQRILLYLSRHGYPDASAEAEVIPRVDGEDVAVVFTIVTGDLVTYGAVTLTGFPDAQLAAARAQAALALPPGSPFDDRAVLGLRDELVRVLERAAYPSPEVAITATRPAPGVATVGFAAEPGTPGTFQSVVVREVPADIEPVVTRVIDLRPGTPYSPEFLDRTGQALRDLDIFRRVELEAVEVAPGNLRLDATAVIRPMVTARASAGSWTDDWIRVTAGWAHRNLFGRARGLELGATYSAHLVEGTARFWWPTLVTPRSRADLMFSYRIEDEDSYRLESRGGSLTNLFSIDPKTSVRVGVEVTRGDLDNRSADPEAFIDDVGLQTIFTGRWFRDSADDALVPSQGHRLGLEARLSVPGLLTDNPFLHLRATESRYLPLRGKRLVAAGRLDVGYAWPLGDAIDLTPQHRFFAGGVSTMRGYRRRDLGPRDSENNPIGGETMVLAGVELRQQLIGLFGAAIFFDAGQVWRHAGDLNLSQIEFAAGVGLMITTPIGPVRLDLAHNLTPPPSDEPRTLLQLGIGHPY